MRCVGGAELRERAVERRLLLVVVVLKFFAIESDEHLARLHAIAEVRIEMTHPAFGFRRNRRLVDSRERAHHLDRAMQRLLPYRFDFDRLCRFAPVRLRRVGFRTACERQAGTRRGRSELAEMSQRVSTHRDDLGP